VTDEIGFEVDDRGVATVTIDRPHVRNALDEASHQRLTAIWEEIEASDHVRVVVVTGAGDRAFCAGADVSGAGIAKTGLEYWADGRPGGFGGLTLRTTLDVPVISRINGYALGGGLELALGGDILVASDNAQLGFTEPRLGRVPLEGGAVLLARRMPYHLAMGMLLTGRKVSAQQAYESQLLNEVVPYDELDAAVERWVTDLLACAPLSVAAIKSIVRDTAHLQPHEAQAARLPALVRALTSKDQDEGVLAFTEKRAPQWKGH
jgi:crotonobetainyl-CoA hydratase